MGRNRVVAPGSDRRPISDGDWIEIKRELNTGDSKRLEAAGTKAVLIQGRLYNIIDWEVHDLERAAIFVTDWSLKGPDDKPLPLNLDSMKSLDQDTFAEINKAIMDHVMDGASKKLKAAKEMKERLDTIQPTSMSDSPSPSEAT